MQEEMEDCSMKLEQVTHILYSILEGTARYAGFLLAPAEGFWPLAKALSLSLYNEPKSIP